MQQLHEYYRSNHPVSGWIKAPPQVETHTWDHYQDEERMVA